MNALRYFLNYSERTFLDFIKSTRSFLDSSKLFESSMDSIERFENFLELKLLILGLSWNISCEFQLTM